MVVGGLHLQIPHGKPSNPYFCQILVMVFWIQYKLTLKTSDGKPEVKQSKDSYLLRLNTASINQVYLQGRLS